MLLYRFESSTMLTKALQQSWKLSPCFMTYAYAQEFIVSLSNCVVVKIGVVINFKD